MIDHARRNEEASVPFVAAESRTGSGIMLQSLLLRPPRFHERVANGVTFPACLRASHNSKPLENGEGVPLSGTYVLASRTVPSNRSGLRFGPYEKVLLGAPTDRTTQNILSKQA